MSVEARTNDVTRVVLGALLSFDAVQNLDLERVGKKYYSSNRMRFGPRVERVSPNSRRRLSRITCKSCQRFGFRHGRAH